MKLTVRPLTPDLWPAFEDLFGKNGACNGCWCMYFRIGSAYRKRLREKNKAAFHEVVTHGPPPALLAFDGDRAVGWCQLTPRDALPWLDRSWRIQDGRSTHTRQTHHAPQAHSERTGLTRNEGT
jgi:hypothetical protein